MFWEGRIDVAFLDWAGNFNAGEGGISRGIAWQLHFEQGEIGVFGRFGRVG